VGSDSARVSGWAWTLAASSRSRLPQLLRQKSIEEKTSDGARRYMGALRVGQTSPIRPPTQSRPWSRRRGQRS
jgi:hypothetical protein